VFLEMPEQIFSGIFFINRKKKQAFQAVRIEAESHSELRLN
jgi:hypothetical protein